MHRLWSVPLLALGCACGSPAAAPARSAEAATATATATLEVMTYNVNFGIEGDPSSIAAIRAESSDVVLLQETTPGWEKSLRDAFSRDYPHMAFRHRGAAGGLGVLSKHEFVERELIEPPEGGWFPAWRLEVTSPIGRLQILNVHLRPQLSEGGSFVSGYFTTPKVRFAEMARYFAHLDPSLPTLVAGDFNEGQRGLAIGYLKKRGFKSALAQFDDSPTWRWPTSVGTVSAELDHLVHTPSLEAVEVRVVEAGRSDHLPVVGRFALRRDRAELQVSPTSY